MSTSDKRGRLILFLGIGVFAATSLLQVKFSVGEENDVKEGTSFSDFINETKACDEDSDCEKMKCSAADFNPVFKKPAVERVSPPEVAKCDEKKCACPSQINARKKFEPFKDLFTNLSTKMPDTDFFKIPETGK